MKVTKMIITKFTLLSVEVVIVIAAAEASP